MEKRNGAPGAIRTPGPQIRSLMLYPAELRAHKKGAGSRALQKVQPRCSRKFHRVEGWMNILPKFTLLSLILGSLLVSACAEYEEVPSLAKRPFENDKPEASAPLLVRTASNAERLGRIAKFLDQARSGRSAFDGGLSTAAKACAAARGAAPASEAWIGAQLAISRLEALRSEAQSALASVDNERRLLATAAPSEDQARVDAALAEIEIISNDQARAVDQLQAQLRKS
jgi:hypothetical protein